MFDLFMGGTGGPFGIGGYGAAVDLGAVYKPVPEVKISLSVKDLGFIVWNANSVELNGIIDYTYQGEKLPYEEGEEGEEIDE